MDKSISIEPIPARAPGGNTWDTNSTGAAMIYAGGGGAPQNTNCAASVTNGKALESPAISPAFYAGKPEK